MWCEDEAGPFQTVPHPGPSWQPEGKPARQPHESVRHGTAKAMTLFHPASGTARIGGTTSCTNAVLHPWLRQELTEILAGFPPAVPTSKAAWERWQAGLNLPITLPAEPPPLRMLLVLDNLAGHKTPTFVLWLFAQGIMPLYTPLSGSWLNMAESIQRVLKRRALDGQHPASPAEVVAWIEAVAGHWNAAPTPFAWGGKRSARRKRERERRHRVGGSGAETRKPLKRAPKRYGYTQRK